MFSPFKYQVIGEIAITSSIRPFLPANEREGERCSRRATRKCDRQLLEREYCGSNPELQHSGGSVPDVVRRLREVQG